MNPTVVRIPTTGATTSTPDRAVPVKMPDHVPVSPIADATMRDRGLSLVARTINVAMRNRRQARAIVPVHQQADQIDRDRHFVDLMFDAATSNRHTADVKASVHLSVVRAAPVRSNMVRVATVMACIPYAVPVMTAARSAHHPAISGAPKCNVVAPIMVPVALIHHTC